MSEVPPVISPAPRRTGWIVYAVIVSFLLLVSVLANLVLFALAVGSGRKLPIETHRTQQYQE